MSLDVKMPVVLQALDLAGSRVLSVLKNKDKSKTLERYKLEIK
jgi:hypothetical protein